MKSVEIGKEKAVMVPASTMGLLLAMASNTKLGFRTTQPFFLLLFSNSENVTESVLALSSLISLGCVSTPST